MENCFKEELSQRVVTSVIIGLGQTQKGAFFIIVMASE
jgi:hypothetical protein